jgi:FtsP/CotA-like multicopper oxidase with cupredoxin domain
VRVLRRSVVVVVCLGLAAGIAWVGWAWWSSRLPGTYSVMDYGAPDYGGGAVPAGAERGHGHIHGGLSVARLRGPSGKPDVRLRLVARKATIRLPSGHTVDALTFGGTSPGPELRARRGDLVEITLVNHDVEPGVTIHWHGIDVPNGEDGVAGVTQNAVAPGASYTYRFRAGQVGTFWYHSHETGSKQVGRGLLGVFVIDPPEGPEGLDVAMVAHNFDGIETLAGRDGVTQRRVAPGTPVRLRLVNTDNSPKRFTLTGTTYRVAAIDGTDLTSPGPLEDTALSLAAGGRYDVVFFMPEEPVTLRVADTPAALALSPDGTGVAPEPESDEPVFDPLAYGRPAPTPFGSRSRFDRDFDLVIGRKPGFLDGRPGLQWTLNGEIYPDVPMFVVARGDLVRMTIENTTSRVHPMHLHGHHMLVLSRNGRPVTGSPWWSDTLDVAPDDRYVVAFRADNPGIWMDHCHNLTHAAAGLTMHVAYAGVATPYVVGGDSRNDPE